MTEGSGTATSTGPSLREQLGAAPDPEFHLRLPAGWVRRTPDDASEAEMERLLRRRLMPINRPDLMAASRTLLRDSFRQMRDSRVVAMFLPLNDEELGYLPVPASMMAVIRQGTPEAPLDEYVEHLIRREGARPLFDDTRIMRCERETERDEGGQRIVMSGTSYVTPVPGTKRKRALEIVASYGRPVDVPRDNELIEAVHTLFDVTLSTLTWRRPRSVRGE
ncbi:hypothetical protein [Microbacterium sp. NPDC096154]|uniref:hypothetical protein n=1 Tax=Microbacterium sp. NPDC096154 TaxID=3155549 RepID=UPI00332B7388